MLIGDRAFRETIPRLALQVQSRRTGSRLWVSHLEAIVIHNEGTLDRVIRLVLGVAAVLLSWWVGFGSLGGVLLLVVAGVALVTGVVGYCPTYQLFKISTNPTFHRTSTPRAKVAAHR